MPKHLNRRSYIQSRTRDPAFLWRMVIGILVAGMVIGIVVDVAVEAWFQVDEEGVISRRDDQPPPDEEAEPSPFDRIEQLAENGDWWALWWGIPRLLQYRWSQAGAAVLAVLTGVCWTLFLIQAAQPKGRYDSRIWAAVAAVLLGILSTWPTFFFIDWQEYGWGLVETGDRLGDARYFILGVGLREEVAKLLCFLPLLPWLLRRRDELTAFIVAACVGVGFAISENIGYIGRSLGTGTLTRLLTPAPAHMAMTGLIGLALYRACRWPRDWGPQFVLVFGLVVFAHGTFNYLLSVPLIETMEWGDQGFLAYAVFLALVFQFFRELHSLRGQSTTVVSLPATFLFCVSLVAAATFVYLSAAVGCRSAADVLFRDVTAEAIMVYLFLREMPESMVTV